MSYEIETQNKKISELKPYDKNINVFFEVVSVGEPRSVINQRSGDTHEVADVVVGDETGTMILSAWNETIDELEVGKTYKLNNGYVNLFRGHMRLAIGRYGELETSEEPLPAAVNMEINRSDEEHEQRRREFGGNRTYDNRGGFGQSKPRYFGRDDRKWLR